MYYIHIHYLSIATKTFHLLTQVLQLECLIKSDPTQFKQPCKKTKKATPFQIFKIWSLLISRVKVKCYIFLRLVSFKD